MLQKTRNEQTMAILTRLRKQGAPENESPSISLDMTYHPEDAATEQEQEDALNEEDQPDAELVKKKKKKLAPRPFGSILG